jgi:carbonic anhydrase
MTTLENIRLNIIEQVNRIQNEDLLKEVHEMLTGKSSAIYKLSEEELQVVRESEEQFKKGLTLSNDEVIEKAREWVNKKIS